MTKLNTRLIVLLGALLLLPLSVRAEEVELSYSLERGVWEVSVYFSNVGERVITFDTGAGYSFLAEDELLVAGGKKQHPVRVRFADGRVIEAFVYVVPEIRVGSCVLPNTLFIGLESGLQGALGLDAIDRMNPVTLDNGMLRFACPE